VHSKDSGSRESVEVCKSEETEEVEFEGKSFTGRPTWRRATVDCNPCRVCGTAKPMPAQPRTMSFKPLARHRIALQ
jgi:hypothetical protein